MLGNKKQVTQCYLLLSCRKVCYYIRYEMALAFADGEQKIRGIFEHIFEQKLFYCQTDKRRDQHAKKRTGSGSNPSPALADAPVEEIEEIVRPCGLGKSKARDISACMKILRDEYNGKVPDDFDKLLKLPGVGRKSANLIMGDVFGKPAIVTDTHCIRLCNRIGLVDKMKDPKKVEMALWKIIPPEEGNSFCHRLVNHGREVCTARTKPYCDKCCLQDICKKVDVK